MMLTLKQVMEDRTGVCVGREVPAGHCAEAT
jgi:hypothetical protein